MLNKAQKLLGRMLDRRQGRVYFIGIKGTGVSALAQILRFLGLEVVGGSDTQEKFWTDEILLRCGIPFVEGFSERNIPKQVDLVVASEAYYRPGQKEEQQGFNSFQAINPEVQEVFRRRLPILTYPEALGVVFNRAQRPVAVAGSHGKSTTVAMLGEILEAAGFEPIVLLGAENLNWQSNVRLPRAATQTAEPKNTRLLSRPDIMVIEADEWQKEAFLNYNPNVLVVTNIDWDHPDHFETPVSYRLHFEKLIHKTPPAGRVMNIQLPQERWLLRVPGEHNQLNATAASLAAQKLGVQDQEIIRRSLQNFRGLRRRFEILGYWQGVPLIDDYAHHPTELKALIRAVQEVYPQKRLLLVFQPHTFSRTEKLFTDFVKALEQAPDPVLLVKTYGSAREHSGREWAQELRNALRERQKQAFYFSSHHELLSFLKVNIDSEQVVVLAGAGDLWQVGRCLLEGQ